MLGDEGMPHGVAREAPQKLVRRYVGEPLLRPQAVIVVQSSEAVDQERNRPAHLCDSIGGRRYRALLGRIHAKHSHPVGVRSLEVEQVAGRFGLTAAEVCACDTGQCRQLACELETDATACAVDHDAEFVSERVQHCPPRAFVHAARGRSARP